VKVHEVVRTSNSGDFDTVTLAANDMTQEALRQAADLIGLPLVFLKAIVIPVDHFNLMPPQLALFVYWLICSNGMVFPITQQASSPIYNFASLDVEKRKLSAGIGTENLKRKASRNRLTRAKLPQWEGNAKWN